MSEIKREVLIEKINSLIVKANTLLRPDILQGLKEAQKSEDILSGKKALSMLIENAGVAANEAVPICQDTGYVDVYFYWPSSRSIRLDLQEIADEAVRQAYRQNPFRASMVSDPLFDRKNTKDNTPANIKILPTKEKNLKVSVFVKGAGSDNSSSVFMLNPSVSENEFSGIIVDYVKENAAKSCPPLIIGIGVGANFDNVAFLAKKALLRNLGKPNSNSRYAGLEEKILNEVNSLGIGASGLGGKTTALGVMIEKAPCHMATLPLAINLSCYALRTASDYV